MVEPTRVRVSGPLAAHQGGWCAELARLGYTPGSAAAQVRLMARLSRWLAEEGRATGELSSELVEEFVHASQCQGRRELVGPRCLGRLLGYLRDVQAVPMPPAGVVSDSEVLLDRFGSYLSSERSLAASTVAGYQQIARGLLSELAAVGVVDLGDLGVADVTRVVVDLCHRRALASPNNMVAALRSLLRYLFAEGITARDLAAAVPTVASWKLASLPRAVDAEVVARLLECCDRATVTGRRDYAILVLLARLGLRSGEVAALDLGDVDWRVGEVTVRGKGSRCERLPVPVDVGEAVVASLGDRHPGEGCRALFIGRYAPRGRMSAYSVGWVVRAACDRAGVPRVGAHRLRHSVATSLLADGASLAEIADLLRHRRLLTTAIYAKVDRRALRSVALPWPGGAA